MKNLYKLILITFTFFIASAVTFAECTSEETVKLNREASAVKLTYEEASEIITGNFGGSDGNYQATTMKKNYLNIIISGLTDNIYIKLTNNNDDSTKTYTSQDASNGVVKIRWDKITEIQNYTYDVYSSSSTNCPNEKIFTNYFTLPMINIYYDDAPCRTNYDEKICAKYTKRNITSSEYEKFVNKVQSKKIKEAVNVKQKKNKGIISFVKNNYKYICAAFVIFTLIVIYILHRIRKGRLL